MTGSSAITIFFLSPIESKNKKINGVERKIYRHRSMVIMVITMISYVLFLWVGIYLYAKILTFAMFSVAVGMKVVKNKKGVKNIN